MIKKTTIIGKSDNKFVTIYVYNYNGQLIEERKSRFSDNMIYTYDSNGNMIGKYQKGKNRYQKIDCREYQAIKLRNAYRKKEL